MQFHPFELEYNLLQERKILESSSFVTVRKDDIISLQEIDEDAPFIATLYLKDNLFYTKLRIGDMFHLKNEHYNLLIIFSFFGEVTYHTDSFNKAVSKAGFFVCDFGQEKPSYDFYTIKRFAYYFEKYFTEENTFYLGNFFIHSNMLKYVSKYYLMNPSIPFFYKQHEKDIIEIISFNIVRLKVKGDEKKQTVGIHVGARIRYRKNRRQIEFFKNKEFQIPLFSKRKLPRAIFNEDVHIPMNLLEEQENLKLFTEIRSNSLYADTGDILSLREDLFTENFRKFLIHESRIDSKLMFLQKHFYIDTGKIQHIIDYYHDFFVSLDKTGDIVFKKYRSKCKQELVHHLERLIMFNFDAYNKYSCTDTDNSKEYTNQLLKML